MFPLRYLTVTFLVKIVTYLNISLSRRHMMQNTYLSIIAFFLKMVHLEHLKNTVLNTYKKQIVWVDNLNVFKIWKCLQLGMKYFRNPFFYNFFTTEEPSMYRKLLQRKLKRYYMELYELSHQSEAKLK